MSMASRSIAHRWRVMIYACRLKRIFGIDGMLASRACRDITHGDDKLAEIIAKPPEHCRGDGWAPLSDAYRNTMASEIIDIFASIGRQSR